MAPIDRSKTMIYKIVCRDVSITDLYVGSTTNITMRRSCHRRVCNNPGGKGYNTYVYDFIRDNGGWDNWELILVENYPECTTGEEGRKRERYWCDKLDASLNTRQPYISPTELPFIKLEAKRKAKQIY